MAIRAETSNSVMRPLLEKWGIKLGTDVQVVMRFEPGDLAKVTIEKILTKSEADDLTEALGDYYLVKRNG
jgi:hypothetical protein